MPTAVAPPPARPNAHDAEVAARLAQAARRIRAQDVLFGVSLLAVVGLGYVAAAVVLDRMLELPGWVRQLGFVGLLAALGVVGWRFVARPLRREVNPLYAAKQIEETVADAKNGIVNWADLRERELPESVRAAVGAKAARQMKDADLDHAGESKRVVWGGAAVAALVVVLAALFLMFRPAVFFSLVGRAVNPFTLTGVATRTQITITEPAAGDKTITAGQPFRVAASVDGKVPDADGPDRMRLLVRHNPAEPSYEEVPMEPAGSGREWQARVPDYLILNGFLYSVAGGDGRTAEHRVTVRPKPLLTNFEVSYEYPKYLRMPEEKTTDPHLEGYRGTLVTVTAKANRPVKDAQAVVAGANAVAAEVSGDGRDTVRVKFPLAEPGSYRFLFTSADGERNDDAPPFPIKVFVDQPPLLTIAAPAEDEVALPFTGTLAIDAVATDDFGLDAIALKMKLADGRALKAKPYQGGKSFRREADGTFPYRVEYKDSVLLAGLVEESGRPVTFREGLVLEYWLEATDNCGVPGPNVGKSVVKRVKIGPPVEPQKQPDQAAAAKKRADQEKAHADAQQKKLEGEQRPAKNAPQKAKDDPKSAPEQGGKGQPMPMGGEPQPGEKKPDGAGEQPPQQGEKKPDPQDGQPNANQPQKDTKQPDPQAAAKQAEQIQQRLDAENQQQGGDARGEGKPQAGEPQPNKPDAGNPMPQPNAAKDEKSPPAQAKKGPPPGDPMNQEPKAGEKPAGEPGDADQKAAPQQGEHGSKESPRNADPKRGEERQQAIEKATRDMAKGNEQEKQAARESLKKEAGDDAAARAEKEIDQLAKDLQSPDDKTRKAAEDKLGELQRELNRDSRNLPKPQDRRDAEYLQRKLDDAMNDMKSGDKDRQDRGKQEMKDQLGEQGAQQAEKLANDMKNGTPQQKKQAEEQFDELKKKQKPQPQQGGAGDQQQPTDQQKQEIADAAKDLATGNEQQKDAARKKLDDKIGEANRKQAEADAQKLADDLKSDDKNTREAAEQKLKDLQKQMQQQAGQKNGQPQPNDAQKQAGQAANDLTKGDEKQKQAARDALDKTVGDEQRKEAEKQAGQVAMDLQSPDDKTRQNAEQKLKDLQNQMQQQAGKPGEAEKRELEQAAKDLGSPDAAKQQAAREKLEKAMGKDAVDKAEKDAKQLADDLKSDDASKRAAAEQKLKDLQQQAKAGADAQKADAKRQEIEKAANDAANGTPDQKQAAKEKLEKQLGPDAAKQAEQLAKDLQSPDDKTREAAKQKLDELAKQAGDKAGEQPKLSPEDVKKLAETAKNLNAKDEQTRKQAERDLDKQIGEKAREQLQKDMKEVAENPDGPRAKELEKQMKELADKWRSGLGGDGNRPGEKLAADLENQKKSAELQLRRFKDLAEDERKIKELGYTKEEYERFLAGYQEYVTDLAKRAEAAKAEAAKPREPVAPPRRVDAAGKVDRRTADKNDPNATGPVVAPPGYGDAVKRLAPGAGEDKPK